MNLMLPPFRGFHRCMLLAGMAFVFCTNFTGRLGAQTPPLATPDTPKPVSVSIDFAAGQQPVTHCASGILLALSETQPPDQYVKPLRLTMFRAWDIPKHPLTAELYRRVRDLGVKHLQVILYNSWISRYHDEWPGDGGDWTKFQQFIDTFYQESHGRYDDFEWDIWNEPNSPNYLPRNQALFFELWRHAVSEIRSIDPKAVIVGPSITLFSLDYLKQFLLFAQKNNVLPDVLSWHELSSRDGRPIPHNVATIRAYMKQQGIPINRISINEIVPIWDMCSPGVMVSYFSALEQAGVESAAKSCWADNNGSVHDENGFPPFLDGLLTIDTQMPRPGWWTYKGYADLTGNYIPLQIDPKSRVDGFAGNDATLRRATILLGSCEDKITSEVHLKLLNLDQVGTAAHGWDVRATVQLIPFRDHDALPAPQILFSKVFKGTDTGEEIVIPKLGPKDACEIILERGPHVVDAAN
jgi:hypothetical protein